MRKLVKKARRDKSQELSIKKLREKLSTFAKTTIIDMYLMGEFDSVSSDEILEEFITEEFGASKGKESLVALFEDKMGEVIKAAIKKARGEGVPCVPVNYSYFELTNDQLAKIEKAEEARPFMAGQGKGNGAFGCRFIIDTDTYDPFYGKWHDHMTRTTNGLIDSTKELTEAGNKQGVIGYSGNSTLVKNTRGSQPLISPVAFEKKTKKK